MPGGLEMKSEDSPLVEHDPSQSDMMQEMCLVVDSRDNMTGAQSKLACHYGKGSRHRAFSVLLFDESDRLLIQKRASEKITFPGVWANSCCSHPLDIEGENGDPIMGVVTAARRKLEQELGIPYSITEDWSFHHMGRMEYSCRWDDEWVEREIDHVLLARADAVVNPNENEISDVIWSDHSQIQRMMDGEGEWENELVSPWFRLLWMNFIEPNGSDPSLMANFVNEEIVYCGEVDLRGNPVSPGKNLLTALSTHRDRVEEEIMESLSKMSQERLHGAMTHLFKGGGKRLRAILPRLVGEAIGNENDGHYTLGASIEIIHNFTLIHDDIIDQDPIRRGLDAVHVAYDDATAINAGDAMLAIGFEILAESENIPKESLGLLISAIGEMVRKVADGQQEDIEFEDREAVTEEDYIAMIAGKTSAMFETCARTGAILANADPGTIENMANWGLNLGLCFQLMDDLIDATGDTETLGKPAGSDILQGKRTLIAIHALESGIEMPSFSKVYGSGKCSAGELENAVAELHDSGSIEYARNRAMKHHSLAHEYLGTLEESKAVGVLRELTDFQLIRIN
ncbi:MAG: isopentenyl-diphosphate delta-isomerase [Candidatus Thalassarchaeaceae archaeon]|nr:isopentenyl-diphosphate delta-isomerase [Candidatus Thalassarchaeaceae archaeon]